MTLLGLASTRSYVIYFSEDNDAATFDFPEARGMSMEDAIAKAHECYPGRDPIYVADCANQSRAGTKLPKLTYY